MLQFLLPALLTVLGSLAIDALVRPWLGRLPVPGRSVAGACLGALISLAGFGFFLAVSGNPHASAVGVLLIHVVTAIASNAKRAVLGEPLVFSDFALVGAVFQHPQFYLSALKMWQMLVALVALIALAVAISQFFVIDMRPHLVGVAILLSVLALLWIGLRVRPFRDLAQVPALAEDVRQLGLMPTLLLYWHRWRESVDPPAHRGLPVKDSLEGVEEETPSLIVVVQCESFADPVELFGDRDFSLPGLEAARRRAWQSGKLLVNGFGAYTMRTEYGVMFGRSEDELGFRCFDPFLTAIGEASFALPRQLGLERWKSIFVHPHDLRFYRRDKVLPSAGFVELVGADRFPNPEGGGGRYVRDEVVGEKILSLARESKDPALIYAVTMENHGPWNTGLKGGAKRAIAEYNRLVRAGDDMLARLCSGVADLGKPSMLVFFGDHRPSIPDVCLPGEIRHTPYVILKFDGNGSQLTKPRSVKDLTPAQLHHAILSAAKCPSAGLGEAEVD